MTKPQMTDRLAKALERWEKFWAEAWVGQPQMEMNREVLAAYREALEAEEE